MRGRGGVAREGDATVRGGGILGAAGGGTRGVCCLAARRPHLLLLEEEQKVRLPRQYRVFLVLCLIPI